MSKKRKDKDSDSKKNQFKQEEIEFDEQQEEFDPEKHGVPNLDELAMRLSVPASEEPYKGLVLFSKSGRVYSVTDILMSFTEFTAQALQIMMELVKKEAGEYERTEGDGQSEKTYNSTGKPKNDKS